MASHRARCCRSEYNRSKRVARSWTSPLKSLLSYRWRCCRRAGRQHRFIGRLIQDKYEVLQKLGEGWICVSVDDKLCARVEARFRSSAIRKGRKIPDALSASSAEGADYGRCTTADFARTRSIDADLQRSRRLRRCSRCRPRCYIFCVREGRYAWASGCVF